MLVDLLVAGHQIVGLQCWQEQLLVAAVAMQLSSELEMDPPTIPAMQPIHLVVVDLQAHFQLDSYTPKEREVETTPVVVVEVEQHFEVELDH